MGKKKVSPKNQLSTWDNVRQEEIRGNMDGIEYAVYLAGFVLHDTYDFRRDQFFPVIWGIQKAVNAYNRQTNPDSFADRADNMIRDIPSYEAMMQRYGLNIESGPYFELYGPKDRPANRRDEIIAYNSARAYAIRAVRCFLFRILHGSKDWSIDGIKEFFSMFDHWDDMHKTGYVTEKEFRQCCDEEYEFQFKSYPKDIPADDVYGTGEDATPWHRYVREQMKNGNV